MNHLIKVNNFRKVYKGKIAVANASFDVEEGKIVGLIGPNGAGKSTILNALLGLIIPSSGELLIENRKVAIDPYFNENVGYVPAEPLFPRGMKVKEFLEFCGMLRDISKSEVNQKLNASSLARLSNQYCTTLSTGQKKLLQLFGINLYQVRLKRMIYILDEPFNGLDPTKRTLLMNEIKKVREKGGSVLLSTHILSDLQELADDIVMLKPSHEGSKVVYFGPKTVDIQKTYEKYFIEKTGKGSDDLFA